MPNIKSAKKRVRQIQNRTQRNKNVRSTVKSAIKRFETALERDYETAKQEYQNVAKTIDKAVSKGVIHENKAARKKSRLAERLNNIAS